MQVTLETNAGEEQGEGQGKKWVESGRGTGEVLTKMRQKVVKICKKFI